MTVVMMVRSTVVGTEVVRSMVNGIERVVGEVSVVLQTFRQPERTLEGGETHPNGNGDGPKGGDQHRHEREGDEGAPEVRRGDRHRVCTECFRIVSDACSHLYGNLSRKGKNGGKEKKKDTVHDDSEVEREVV